MIPFVTVTLFYSVPLKYISGYYSASENIIKDIFIGQVIIQGNTHLWFLPTLFIIFTIVYVLVKYIKVDNKFILLVLFAISLISTIIRIEIIKQPMEYTFWFYVGYCFENIREKINTRVEKTPCLLLIGIFVFMMALVLSRTIPKYQEEDVHYIIDRILRFILAFSSCFSVYVFCFMMSKTSIKETMVYKSIRKYSLGLYLYSDSWNYIILSVTVGLFGNAVFITNFGALLFYFCRIIITYTVAIAVSILLKKLNVKYIC